jgi:phage anti-repressor protein
MKIIKNDNQNLISSKELYAELGIKRDFSTWIKQSIERADLEENKDFTPIKGESTGGRPTIDYLLVRDAALTVIMMSGGQYASQLRKTVIELYNQHNTGLAFNVHQIEALIDLSKAMTLVSIQKHVEKKHFTLYNHPETWWDYRAGLLGYSKNSLIEAMREVNKKHHSIKTSLIQLDADELIRTGVIDLMCAIGKTNEYAVNVGNLCKSIASKMKLRNMIWDDTAENPLKLNQSEITEKESLFNDSIKKISSSTT